MTHNVPVVSPRLVPIVLTQGFGLVCGVAGVKVATKLVTPAHYGLYAVFVSFAPLGMWVIHAGIIKFVLRHWGAGDRPALLHSATAALNRKWPWLAVAAGASVLALPGASRLLTFALLFAAAWLLSWAALAQAALQAERQHWRDFAVSAAGSLSRSFVPPLLYAGLGGSLLALYGGFLVHAAVLAGAGMYALRQSWLRASPSAGSEVMPAYSGTLFIWLAIAGWIMAGHLRWLTAAFFGADTAGYFALAANLATLIPSVLGTIALQYFQPEFFAGKMGGASPALLSRKVDQVAIAHAVGTLAGLALLRLAAPSLIGTLIGARYAAAIDWLVPAGTAMLGLVTGWFYHAMMLAAHRESECGRVELTAAAAFAIGSVTAAAAGEEWLRRWMFAAPLVPWLINRPLARRSVQRPDAAAVPAPGP